MNFSYGLYTQKLVTGVFVYYCYNISIMPTIRKHGKLRPHNLHLTHSDVARIVDYISG